MEEIKSNLEGLKNPRTLDAKDIFDLGMSGVIPKNNAIENLFTKYYKAESVREKNQIVRSIESLFKK